ncbi:MAG: amino acid adenylation domain-containing protein, partial [Chloroflexi bacterium]|nr:amino acid adenylation domain-containing protein [Chloroflexota bacterium]
GKLDYRALPPPGETRPELAQAYVAPRTPAEKLLAPIWQEVLGIEQVGVHDNFFTLGGDSILTIQIVARANQAGLQLTPRQLFQYQTIAELASIARQAEFVATEQGVVTGEVPLTPIQHWFFAQEWSEPHYWNQSVLLELRPEVNPALLEQALRELAIHHDALRLRFFHGPAGWQAVNAGLEAQPAFRRVELSSHQGKTIEDSIKGVMAEAQAGFNLNEGPLMQALWFHAGAGRPDYLAIIIHHLLVDSVSWRILLEDLRSSYEQLAQNQSVHLPAKTTSYKAWAEKLNHYAGARDWQDELAFWLSRLQFDRVPLPVDRAGGLNIVAAAGAVTVALELDEAQTLLRDLPAIYRVQVNELLLAALASTICRWTNQQMALIDVEGHGREDVVGPVDLSRTAGWFTTVYPVCLVISDTTSPAALLRQTREQLRAIPDHGIGYGLLRYLHKDEAIAQRLVELPQAEIAFNYLGQFTGDATGPFKLLPEFSQPAFGPRNERPYLLEVNAGIFEGQLRVTWVYAAGIHHRATVETLAGNFIDQLRAFIKHGRSNTGLELDPADFPLARLGAQALDVLSALVDRAGAGSISGARNVADIYPLSPGQQGIFFHALYAPESEAYFEQFSFRLLGELDVAAFQKAWKVVINRHPALRSGFYWDGLEKPLQVVYQSVTPPWQVLDWRERGEAQQQGLWADFLRKDRQQGFDLTAAPLMRLALVRLSEATYHFVWSAHHLLLDGWSGALILKELATTYHSLRRQEPPPLADAPPYRDYIAWCQRQDLGQAELFWRQVLKGFTAPTPLIIDKGVSSAPPAPERYGQQQILLPATALEKIQRFARQHQLTIGTIVQGTWALLLSRYSGEREVVFGVTVAGRPATLPGAGEMVGLFINTLPVRVKVPGQASPVTWLRTVQEQLSEAQQYAYIPLGHIQRWSELPAGRSLFDSIIVFENYPVDWSLQKMDGNVTIAYERVVEQTNYPLTVAVMSRDGLQLAIGYDMARFDDAAIERLLGHLQMALIGLVAESSRSLSGLSLLTPAEWQQMVVTWNETQRPYPHGRCVHELFEARVARTPEATAILFEGQPLTYVELNRQANQLAHYLQSSGVQPEARVAIYVNRSPEMIMSLLAVLKAGGAYVPLDPAHPAERLDFILTETQAGLLLTHSSLLAALPGRDDIRFICLDQEWPAIGAARVENPASGVDIENAAYVMYTSGSTGRPKGVVITHRGLGNLAQAQIASFGVDAESRVLQFASFGFDVSVTEILMALLSGATLCLASQEALLPGSSLAQLMDDLAITTVTFTPSVLAALPPGELPHLKTIVAVGEPCPIELVRSWSKGRCFVNAYGPTETVCATISTCLDGSRPLAVGRPMPNTQLYLLDAHGQPAPVGVPGEVYVGGVGLGRGYLNQPRLTAERFVPDPFGREAGGRLYRTGDLARYLPDGRLEFLGRLDHQVKIRGFRVELEEVDQAVKQYPPVAHSAVVAREESPGVKRLVAYVAPEAGQRLTVSELRLFLKQKLPEYMIPSIFVLMDKLPLTPNGKVDREALPAPDGSRPALAEAFIAPRTAVEEQIAAIWQPLLGIEQVGIEDNFFELGGHSLLATQVISRLRQAFRVELPLRAIFEAPTIAELVERLERDTPAQYTASIGRRTPGSHAPLSFAQQRMWFLSQLNLDQTVYNIPTAVRLLGPLDVATLEKCLAGVVQRHEILRTSFPVIRGEPVQAVASSVPVAIPVVSYPPADQTRLAWVQEQATSAARQPFNLAQAPLWRARLLRLAEEEHILLLVMHHIISDGWSMRVLIQELSSSYELLRAGRPALLPEWPIQYGDFAAWQREHLNGEAMQADLAYWRKQLANLPPPLALAGDRPRPAWPGYRGGSVWFTLSPELAGQLRTLGQEMGGTLFITLLAAFQVLLYRYTGQLDILVGSPIANRNHSEIEGLIGFFVNTLVLRGDLSGNPTFRHLLAKLQEVALAAYAHQNLPFEKLVEELKPERNLGHHPFIQVLFVLHNTAVAWRRFAGLTPELVELDSHTAQFDLTLSIRETPQGLRGMIEYNSDLFEEESVGRLARHYEVLLAGAAANPDQPIARLPLLSQAEC